MSEISHVNECGWSDCFTCPYDDCRVDLTYEPECATIDKKLSKAELQKQKRLEYFRKYNEAHKEQHKQYRQANREKYVEYSRNYYQKNKERLKAIERDRIRLRRSMEALGQT